MGIPILSLLVGLLSGFISGFFGVGGGIVLVPALVMLLQLPIHKAVGISLAVIVPTAVAGVVRHSQFGNVDLRVAVLLAAGAVGGALIGATVANWVSAAWLRRAFGAFLVVVGLILMTGWGRPSRAATGAPGPGEKTCKLSDANVQAAS